MATVPNEFTPGDAARIILPSMPDVIPEVFVELQKILFVGMGGFAGAALRYLVSLASASLFGSDMPWGTLIVNAVGGLLAGLVMEMGIASEIISPTMRLFLMTGILGGLTTFSAFSWETMSLFSDGSYLRAGWNILLNVALSLGAVALGRLIVNQIL